MRAFDQTLIVSPPFSCGVGFLIEMLLRLDVRIDRHGWEHWCYDAAADEFELTASGVAELTKNAAILRTRRRFAFADRKSALVEHRMDLLPGSCGDGAVILFVRDPVDAVYSWWRRHEASPTSDGFARYLEQIDYFRWHLPYEAMHVPPLMVFALFVQFWRLAAPGLTVVRFEDMKREPLVWMRRVLNRMGVDRTDAQIEAAANASGFEALRDAGAPDTWNAANRRSRTEEWRERMTEAAHTALLDAAPVRAAASRLGYLEAASAPDSHGSRAWRWCRDWCDAALAAQGEGLVAAADVCALLGRDFAERRLELVDFAAHESVVLDAMSLDGITGVANALSLLQEAFAPTPPQRLSRLCRLIPGLAALLAQAAPLPEMRHALRTARVFPPTRVAI